MRDPWRVLLDQQPRPPPVPEIALGGGGSGGGDSSADEVGEVPRISATELSYERFYLDYMEANRPVILQEATRGWAAARDWVAPGGGVDLAFLRARFGTSLVSATDTAREHEGCGPCQQMRLADFLDWWERRQQQQQREQEACAGMEALHIQPAAATPAGTVRPAPPGTAQPQGAAGAASQAPMATALPPAGGPLWYVKDWHLASEFPQYEAYRCPPWFADDWLNEWYDAAQAGAHAVQAQEGENCSAEQRQAQEPQAQAQQQQHLQHAQQPQQPWQQQAQAQAQQQQPPPQQQQQAQTSQQQQAQPAHTADYRFVYLGPRGTSTPLHSDVLRSHSWSANVAGRKLWRLLPPWLSHLLLDRHGRSTAWDFFAADPEGRYPGLPEARRHLLTAVQLPGEAIFVPAGWFHTVENLDDCISINHNWINGHSVHWTWALLRSERAAAAECIDDCRPLCGPAEFEGLVQRNLGANAGLDFAGLGALLRCTAAASLRQLGAAAATPGNGSSAAQHEQQQQQRQQDELADAGTGAAAPQPAGDDPGGPAAPAGRWYHAFRLLRASLVLRELLAEQRQLDAACGQERLKRRWQSEQGVAAAGAVHGPGSVGGSTEVEAEDEALPHAAEAAANAACLAAIEQQLEAMGIRLQGTALHDAH